MQLFGQCVETSTLAEKWRRMNNLRASCALREAPADQASRALTMVYECGASVTRSFFASQAAERIRGSTVVLPKSFSDLMSGPFTSVTETGAENCLSSASNSASIAW